MLQQLIDILKHAGFTINDIPGTVYLLLKCDEFVLDSLELFEYTFRGTKDTITYYRPEDIISYVLNNKSLTEGWVDRSSPSLTVEHPSHSEAWKKCEDYFENEIVYSNARLLLPVLWIDGFVGELTRKKTYCAFSLTFANFSNKLMAQHKSRFGIANLPPCLLNRKNEFIQDVLVPFFLKLETRKLKPLMIGTTYTSLVGRLFTIKGDHIAKIELAGIAGTKGHRGAFYSLTTQKDYANVDMSREWRHAKQSSDIIERLQTLVETAQKKLKKASGLRLERSPFWDLPLFSEDFYRNFSSCGLHLLSLGIIKRLAKCIGVKLGHDYRIEATEEIPKIPPPSNFDTISMSIYGEAGKPRSSSLSGGMWRTYAAASIIFNKDHLQEGNNYNDWKYLMNSLLAIFRVTLTKEELMQDGDFETKIKELQKTMMRLFPVEDGFNYKFPNFEALIALPRQILFLGPLHFQSTEREEEMNRRRRQVLQSANRVNPSSHITKVIEKERAAGEVTFEEEDGTSVTFNDLFSRKNIKTKPDYLTFGHGEHSPVGKHDRPRLQELFAREYQVEIDKIKLEFAYNVKAFYFNDKRVFSGPNEGLLLNFEDQIIAGVIVALFVVDATIGIVPKQTRQQLLCALLPIKMTDLSGSVREGKLRKTARVEFYPLGWGGHEVYKPARVIRPSPSSREVFVWF